MTVRKTASLQKSAGGKFSAGRIVSIILGTAIVSFGLHNVHQQANITEGGILGLILLINRWTGVSIALLSPLLDALAYVLAVKVLGKDFLKAVILSTVSLTGFFFLWERLPFLLPSLESYPLAASLVGGVFIGAGVGLVVRQGGSCAGDDALALTMSKLFGLRIMYAYFITDSIVLLLSLTYIPLSRIGYSLLAMFLSSVLVDLVQNVGKGKRCEAKG